MATFKFNVATTKRIVDAYNNNDSTNEIITDVLAFSTIQKYYGTKSKIHVFKTYKNLNKIYAYYEENETILTFNTEEETYKFILGY